MSLGTLCLTVTCTVNQLAKFHLADHASRQCTHELSYGIFVSSSFATQAESMIEVANSEQEDSLDGTRKPRQLRCDVCDLNDPVAAVCMQPKCAQTDSSVRCRNSKRFFCHTCRTCSDAYWSKNPGTSAVPHRASHFEIFMNH